MRSLLLELALSEQHVIQNMREFDHLYGRHVDAGPH